MKKNIVALCAVLALTTQIAVAADAASPLKPGVVARQGGAEVTLEDIDAQASKIPDKDRPGFFDSPKRIESVIMSLLLQKQLANVARAEKLDKDPTVQRAIAVAVDDTLAGAQLAHYRKSLKLPNFEVLAKEYYDSHQDEFTMKGSVVVDHVLVSTKDRNEQDAKTQIAKVESQARANPDNFAELVEKYSDDPSKTTNHGRIEKAGSTKMAKPFAAAANALTTPGEISPIVKTEYGFHILKLIERTPDHQTSFDEAKSALVVKLRNNYLDTQVNQYSGEMRGKPLQANPDIVASLRTRYQPAGYQTPQQAQEAGGEAAKNRNVEEAPPKH